MLFRRQGENYALRTLYEVILSSLMTLSVLLRQVRLPVI